MQKYSFELFADYFQIYLMDIEADDDTSDVWTDEALSLKLGLLSNTVAVGTFRNVDVKVELEIHEHEPDFALNEWDNISIGYFSVKSGCCVVLGCTDYLPDAAKVEIPLGHYSVLSLAKGLDSITEEWEEADDLYKLILWPSANREYRALKTYGGT